MYTSSKVVWVVKFHVHQTVSVSACASAGICGGVANFVRLVAERIWKMCMRKSLFRCGRARAYLHDPFSFLTASYASLAVLGIAL